MERSQNKKPPRKTRLRSLSRRRRFQPPKRDSKMIEETML